MIERLWIQNFALIEKSEVEFGKGLNIITGETGAGKSIFIGALSALMGKKTDAAAILDPEKKSIIEAKFLINSHQIPENIWQELDCSPEKELIIRREISAQGKSRFFINDTPVNQNLLKEIMEYLVELHGQHEGQKILSKDYQLSLLDHYGDLQTLAQAYQSKFQELQSQKNLLHEKKANAQKITERIEFLQFQLKDFETYELIENEDDEIEKRLKILQNAETIKTTLEKATLVLYESEKSVYTSLVNVEKVLDKIGHLSPKILHENQKLKEADVIIADVAQSLRAFYEEIDVNSTELEKLLSKLDFYNRLKKKFNVLTVKELKNIQQQLLQELKGLQNFDEEVDKITAEIQILEREVAHLGAELDSKRKQVSIELTEKVNNYFKAVALPNAEFKIEFIQFKEPQKRGLSEIQFKVRTNVGLPEGLLSQIASGGEISRIMLAIKAALAEKLELSTLIFDEIDTGISGEIALKVAKVMEKLSERFQVIIITHLPQMASRSGEHYFIYKEVKENKTYSRIKKLSENERIEQIAKMLYGENPPLSAIENAKTLLQTF
jgi:DNA repair protein RecN (Recombination protein N)